MISWFWLAGYGHAVVSTDDDGVMFAACDKILEPAEDNDVRESHAVTERPFGVDSCRFCHNAAKRWAVAPEELPEYAKVAAVAPAGPRRLTAAERRAALAGEQAEPVSVPADAAPAPVAPVPVQNGPAPEPGSDEDLGLEPVGPAGGPAVVAGATLVVPAAGGRKRSSRAAADVEIDSD
jgi:hypothetical protein